MRARMSASVDSVGFSVIIIVVVPAVESCVGIGDDGASRSAGVARADVKSRADVESRVGLALDAIVLGVAD